MRTVSFTQFRNHASEMLTKVQHGEVLVVMRHGHPIAEISPVPRSGDEQPSWKRPALRLTGKGKNLSRAILEERET